MNSLIIKNLKVSVEGKQILKSLNLKIKSGEIHALMGPNGSGKSTLASSIMGHPRFKLNGGSIIANGKRINKYTPEARAKLGLFLSFQYPIEVPGLSINHFLRTAYNNLNPKKQMAPLEFNELFNEKLKLLNIKKQFGQRSLNEGFSGGEKKKLEILQMAILQPSIAILDETDSGLDIDALRTVAQGIKKVKTPKMSILLITHYFRILRYVKPDKVHIMNDGQIIKSGTKDLATKVERRGYDWLIKK